MVHLDNPPNVCLLNDVTTISHPHSAFFCLEFTLFLAQTLSQGHSDQNVAWALSESHRKDRVR
jgi:hypothetical protein